MNQLWELIPVNREADRILLLAWLTFCLTPVGAKPILTLHGAKGAGKSWTAETLSQLVDPVKAPLLKAVGDNRGMAVTASKRWLLAFDNLTSLTTAEQDILCCTATGAGFSHRKLHTDMDEVFYEYTRPQVLTSVDCIPTRSDLLDRCLLIAVDRIPEEQRIPLEQLTAMRESYRPALLGCLLDQVAQGLKHKETITAPLPRMADFARFAMATEKGNQSGSLKNQDRSGSLDFATAYRQNIASAVDKAIDSNPVAAAILELMNTCNRWEGSAGDLLSKLQSLSDDPRIKKLTSRGLGRWLGSTANQVDLRAVGIETDSYRKAGGNRERGWLLSHSPEQKAIRQEGENNVPNVPNVPNPDKHGENSGTLSGHYPGHYSENVPKCPTNNVLNVPPEKPRISEASEKESMQDRDVRDIWDIISGAYSCGTGSNPASGQTNTPSSDPDQTRIFKVGQMVRYIGSDPEIRKYLPDPAPIVDVFPANQSLWVMRPCKIPLVVPMADVEVVA